ncbi:MAG: TetR/AcrR family transcriptional regulator [Caldilineales bacterium]
MTRSTQSANETPDVRQLILQESGRLFVDRGYHGLSMREVAEAVGVSKAALYYHYRDKEDLFLAVLTSNLDRIEQVINESRKASTTREQIEQMVQAIFQRAPEQRAIIRLASQEMDQLSDTARAEFSRLYHEKFIGQVEAIISEGIANSELRAMNPSLATWLLLGMMYPFFYTAHAGEMTSFDETTALMLDIFFDGAGAR